MSVLPGIAHQEARVALLGFSCAESHLPRRGKTGPRPLAPEVRFWKKVTMVNPDECWEWQGQRTKRRRRGGWGYGRFIIDTDARYRRHREVYAHRYSYELAHGPIPDGMVVRHVCDNPGCVNPSHLSLGTQADNVRDRDERGRQRTGYSGRTHCRRGHEFTPENTYHRPDAPHQRLCRACARMRKRGTHVSA